MKIALVHYHARPGGVTQVLLHSAKALRQRGWDVLTILGEPPTAEWPESAGAWSAVSGLGYRSEGEPGDIPLLHRALQAEVIRHWGQSPDLWLVHNACLAKNVVLCGVIERMAEEEAPVLLQIHDFAEDGRAANLAAARRYHASLSGVGEFSQWLHPSGAGLHRAVLTHRDLALLQRCGFSMDRLHWMPNAVSVIPSGRSARAIRCSAFPRCGGSGERISENSVSWPSSGRPEGAASSPPWLLWIPRPAGPTISGWLARNGCGFRLSLAWSPAEWNPTRI
ncbi:MAG: hypothetical protein R3F31_06730 [Verrucomicrobiales bacterium]